MLFASLGETRVVVDDGAGRVRINTPEHAIRLLFDPDDESALEAVYVDDEQL